MRVALTLPVEGTMEAASFAMPYGIAVVAALLRRRHPDAELFFSDDEAEVLGADLIYCSGLSEAWDRVNALGAKATALGKRFVVGGQHVTALPRTLRHGEAFAGPLETFGDPWPNPLPDWSVFPESARRNARFTLMTSRGCPFKCRFCSSSAFWRGYTAMPVDRIIAEIEQVAALGAGEIVLFDDLFTADIGRLRAVSERIVAEGLNRIRYNCLVRADRVSPEVLDLLRAMNVTAVSFGAESGSDAMLDAMNKKTTRAANQRCIDLLCARGYDPVCSLVLGFPGETPETLRETLAFVQANEGRCRMEAYPAQPLPGTWLWDYFMREYAPSLDAFPWASLCLRGDRVDWDSYWPLSKGCAKEDLRACVERCRRIANPPTGLPRRIARKARRELAGLYRKGRGWLGR